MASRSQTGPARDSITCPQCGRTSYNVNDIEQGYCGNCHDWTSAPGHLKWHTLTEEIELLERRDPKVRRAARRLDEAIAQLRASRKAVD